MKIGQSKYVKVVEVVEQLFITRPEFAAYLSKNLTKKFHRFDPGNCPLARATGAVIATEGYTFNAAGKLTPLPKWAQRFIYRLDKEGFTGLMPKKSEIVTGREALAILKKVK